MTTQTGFSNVDASTHGDELVDYLAMVAKTVAQLRQADYEQLNLREGMAMLDVGCGAGEVCVELATRVGARGRMAGIDPSEIMIAAAQRAVAASGQVVDLQVGSIYALPFPDATFDVVRAERVFQHLDNPEAGLREMLRVTRKGGRVMVIDPDHSQWGMGLDNAADRRVYAASLRAMMQMIVNPCVGTALRGLFRQARLIDVAQQVRSLELAHPDYLRASFLQERLAAAVAAGEITVDEAQKFMATLAARHAAGTFFCNAIGYSVVGTKA